MSETAPVARRPRPGFLGLMLLTVWLTAAVTLVAYLTSVFSLDFLRTYGPAYWNGLLTTLILVGLSFSLGALLSVPIALGSMSDNRIARTASGIYVTFFRGTPLLAQIFVVYYGLGTYRWVFESVGLWWFFREAWYCAIFSLTLNTAAYQSEILRGAVRSVGVGQWEGARSLALPRGVTWVRIVLPQALVVALRPYANELILLVKASAVVAIITVFDLFGETRRIFSRTFDFQAYIWAAIVYLLIVEMLRHLTDAIERRATRHLRR